MFGPRPVVIQKLPVYTVLPLEMLTTITPYASTQKKPTSCRCAFKEGWYWLCLLIEHDFIRIYLYARCPRAKLCSHCGVTNSLLLPHRCSKPTSHRWTGGSTPVVSIPRGHKYIQGHQAEVVDTALPRPISRLLPPGGHPCPCPCPCPSAAAPKVRPERVGLPGGVSQLGGIWGEGLQAAPGCHHLWHRALLCLYLVYFWPQTQPTKFNQQQQGGQNRRHPRDVLGELGLTLLKQGS